MGTKELINLMKYHISEKITDLSASDPHRTPDQKLAIFWCGRQTATWAMDLIWAAKNDGVINFDEMTEYERAISDLNVQLNTMRP